MGRTRILTLNFLLALSFALTACSSTLKEVVEKPKVELDKVRVQDVTEKGATVVFGLKVDNPNTFDINLDSIDYDIQIGGKDITRGELTEGLKLAASDTSLIDLPIQLKFSDIFSSLETFLFNGKSPYRIQGNAKLSVFTIPFNHTGELKLKD